MSWTWSDPDAEPLEWFGPIPPQDGPAPDQTIDKDLAERLSVRVLMLQWVRENYKHYRARKKSEERDRKNGQGSLF